MDKQQAHKKYFSDTVRISGQKRAHVQNALKIDPKKVASSGNFVKVFADMFLRKEESKRFV